MQINGKTLAPKPLTYGQVKANGDTLDKFTSDGATGIARLEPAAQILRLAFPDLTEADTDATAPGVLIAGAVEIYTATFARPEADAPAAAV